MEKRGRGGGKLLLHHQHFSNLQKRIWFFPLSLAPFRLAIHSHLWHIFPLFQMSPWCPGMYGKDYAPPPCATPRDLRRRHASHRRELPGQSAMDVLA